MKTSELLIQAKALIDTPEKWTQNVSARNKDGHSVNPSSADAVCFCSYGALMRTYAFNPRKEALNALYRAMGVFNVADFNDNSTHEEVMAAWDEAIRLQKEAEQ